VTFSVFQESKAMGLTLAVDDFGTGYSRFNYLRQFRVSKLKIDRMFIWDVAVNPDDAAITDAVISLAKRLNLKVVAEGVENEAQTSRGPIRATKFKVTTSATLWQRTKLSTGCIGDQQEALARAQNRRDAIVRRPPLT
jgi:predicted signal transduction protein with EAL and GGDEF domain